MRIAGGGASGHATLRRDGDAVTLTGALALDSVDLDRPGFSGRVGAALDFASTGRSPAAVIGELAGSGAVTLTGAALARSDPAALDRVVAKAQTPDAPLDETNIAFAFSNELNRGPLAIPDGPAPLSLSAGVVEDWSDQDPRKGSGRDAERRPRSAQTRRRDAACAHFVGQRFEVLVGAAAERGGGDRKCSGGAEATDRRQLPFRRARRPGDRARDRSHLDDGSRHSRARVLQPAAQGRAVHGSTAPGNRGLASRATAAEGAGRAVARPRGSGEGGREGGGEEGRRRQSRGGERRIGQARRDQKGEAAQRQTPRSRPLRRRRATKWARMRRRQPRRPRRGRRRGRRKSTRRRVSSTDRRNGAAAAGPRVDNPALSASSTNTRMADDRLAPSREASTIAASRLRDSPRSAAMRRSRRQNASSSEMLVRCPAMTSERLTTRAFGALSRHRAASAGGRRAGLGERALALGETLLGLRAAEDGAVLGCFRLLALAVLLLSRPAQVDDLAQDAASAISCERRRSTRPSLRRRAPPVSPRSERASRRRRLCGGRLAGAGFAGAGARSCFLLLRPAPAQRLAAGSETRGSSLNPNGTDGSVKPVIESNGTVNRSGLREKLRLTSNASSVTTRSQNSCWRMIDISSGKRCLTAGGATTPGAWVLNAILKWCSPMSPLRAASARTLRTTERSASCTRRS